MEVQGRTADLNSPVQNCRKFSAVLGTTSANSFDTSTQYRTQCTYQAQSVLRALEQSCEQMQVSGTAGGVKSDARSVVSDFHHDAARVAAA